MKKPALFISLPVLFATFTGPAIAQAATVSTTAVQQQHFALSLKSVYFNGKLATTAYGFANSGTTYMPVWYIMQILKQLNITSDWNNPNWKMDVPKTYQVDTANLPNIPSANPGHWVTIAINQTSIERAPGMVYVDPDSGRHTEFLPIWYIQQALNRLGVQSAWNGTDWHLSYTPPKQAQTAPEKSSSQTTKPAQSSTSSQPQQSTGTSSSASSQGQPTSSSTSSTPAQPTVAPIAEYGDSGTTVQYIQQDLNLLGYSVGPVDGQFGPMTMNGVKEFQSANQLDPTGIVDDTTWTTLETATIQAEEAKHITPTNTQSGSTTGSTSTNPGSTTSSTSGATSSNSGSGSTPSSSSGASTVSAPSFTNVDLRFPAPADVTATSIDSYLEANNSPMAGLGQIFMDTQNTYGVDANYLVSHAILESYWGKSQIALAKNNLYGYGAYDSNPGSDAGMFPSDAYAIEFQGWEVRNNYLTPGSSLYVSPTLTGMNVNYATDPNWASSIGNLMNQFASFTNDSVNNYPQYSGNPNNPEPPAPESTIEPEYIMTGATGVVESNPYYGNLPYYASMDTGMNQMFFGPLQVGSIGSNVAAVQSYLNQVDNAGLQVDGQFGPDTEAAVKQFETAHNLPVDGIWNYSMWNMFNTPPSTTVPAGTTVQIEAMKQGMAGGIVTEWYDLAGYGWVDSAYVQMQNVYRLTVANPGSAQTSVPVYAANNPNQVIATLHAGDFVICNQPNPTNGYITIQFANVNPNPSQVMTGVINTSIATLTQQK